MVPARPNDAEFLFVYRIKNEANRGGKFFALKHVEAGDFDQIFG